MAKPKAPEKPEALRHNPFAAFSKDAAPDDKRTSGPKPESPAKATSEAPRFGTGKIVLRREKKGRGGKTVTRVEGLPHATLSEFAVQMKRALGCGAKVEGESLILLGSLVDRAAEWLRSEGASHVVEGN